MVSTAGGPMDCDGLHGPRAPTRRPMPQQFGTFKRW